MDARFKALSARMDETEFNAVTGVENDLLLRAMEAANGVLAAGGSNFMVGILDTVEMPPGFRAEQCQQRTVCTEELVCENGICRRQRTCRVECVP